MKSHENEILKPERMVSEIDKQQNLNNHRKNKKNFPTTRNKNSDHDEHSVHKTVKQECKNHKLHQKKAKL